MKPWDKVDGAGVPFENDNRSKTDHRAPEGLKYEFTALINRIQ
jgi:hypothetical protein